MPARVDADWRGFQSVVGCWRVYKVWWEDASRCCGCSRVLISVRGRGVMHRVFEDGGHPDVCCRGGRVDAALERARPALHAAGQRGHGHAHLIRTVHVISTTSTSSAQLPTSSPQRHNHPRHRQAVADRDDGDGCSSRSGQKTRPEDPLSFQTPR